MSPFQISKSTEIFTLGHVSIIIQTHKIRSCMEQSIFRPSHKNISPKVSTSKNPPSSASTVTPTGMMLAHGKAAIRGIHDIFNISLRNESLWKGNGISSFSYQASISLFKAEYHTRDLSLSFYRDTFGSSVSQQSNTVTFVKSSKKMLNILHLKRFCPPVNLRYQSHT